MRRTVVMALLVAALPGCGESPLFEQDELPPLAGTVYRLTASGGSDRAAAWLPEGDSVVYVAEGYPGIPPSPGVPVALDVRGGRVRVLAAGRLAQGLRWVEAVAPARDGDRLALAELALTSTGPACVGDTPADESWCALDNEPRIDSLAVVVVDRDVGHTQALWGHATGSRGLATDGSSTRVVQETTPFQQRFTRTGAMGAVPSWDPAGERLVVSDGRRLLLWTPATGAVDAIPGTENGIDPAWSPDGTWIAYTRLLAGEPTVAACSCGSAKVPTPITRTVHPVIGVELVVVRPDGTDGRVVAAGGQEPAWAPDGRVYFRQGGAIRRALPDVDATAEDVPETEGGQRPAVSPDGTWLAFQRPGTPGGAMDVWITRLTGGRP